MSPKKLVITLCLMNLLTGLALGFAVARLRLLSPLPLPNKDIPPPVLILTNYLELDEAQQREVLQIFRELSPQAQQVIKPVQEELTRVRDAALDRVHRVLRPTQAERFDRFRSRLERAEGGLLPPASVDRQAGDGSGKVNRKR